MFPPRLSLGNHGTCSWNHFRHLMFDWKFHFFFMVFQGLNSKRNQPQSHPPASAASCGLRSGPRTCLTISYATKISWFLNMTFRWHSHFGWQTNLKPRALHLSLEGSKSVICPTCQCFSLPRTRSVSTFMVGCSKTGVLLSWKKSATSAWKSWEELEVWSWKLPEPGTRNPVRNRKVKIRCLWISNW